MNTTRIGAAVLAAATAAVIVIAGPASADTIASETPPVVLAQDTTPATATIPADVVGIDANIVGGLTVTGHHGKTVTATAKGRPTRTATVPASRPAVLKGLAPGVRYAVSIGGRKVAIAVPLARVGGASALRVETTTTPGTVQLTWDHAVTANEGAKVTYDVTATPLNDDGTDGRALISVTSTGPSATLTGLDTKARYRFAVTPRNTASTGRASSATMTRTLADITGTSPKKPEPAAVAPQGPATPPTPAPAPAPAPTTRTIYVCPADTTPNGSLCRKVSPYTWDVKAYTYHPETYTYTAYGAPYVVRAPEIAPGPTCAAGWSPAWDNDPILGSVNAHCEQTRQDPYTATGTRDVKDATPAGYTDTGSNWTRKNPAPTGYTDDGTQWIIDLPKIAEVVPASERRWWAAHSGLPTT